MESLSVVEIGRSPSLKSGGPIEAGQTLWREREELLSPSLKSGGPIEAIGAAHGRELMAWSPSLKSGGPIEAPRTTLHRPEFEPSPSLKSGGPIEARPAFDASRFSECQSPSLKEDGPELFL